MCSSTTVAETHSASSDKKQDSIHLDEEQVMQQADLNSIMREWEASKPRATITDDLTRKTFRSLRRYDVLFGRGPVCAARAGNSLLRQSILQNGNCDYYRQLEPSQKKRAAMALVDYFEAQGLRFVEVVVGRGGHPVHPTLFALAPYHRKVLKVQQSLRDLRKRDDDEEEGMLHAPSACATATSKQSSADKPTKQFLSDSHTRKQKAGTGKGGESSTTSSRPTNSGGFAQSQKILAKLAAGKTRRKRSLVESVTAGDRLGIYWPLDREYYPCVVASIVGTRARVHYDDGDSEELDLRRHEFLLLKRQPVMGRTIEKRKRPGKSEIAQSIEKSLVKAYLAKVHLMTKEAPMSTAGTLLGEMSRCKPVDRTVSDEAPQDDSASEMDEESIDILQDSDAEEIQDGTMNKVQSGGTDKTKKPRLYASVKSKEADADFFTPQDV